MKNSNNKVDRVIVYSKDLGFEKTSWYIENIENCLKDLFCINCSYEIREDNLSFAISNLLKLYFDLFGIEYKIDEVNSLIERKLSFKEFLDIYLGYEEKISEYEKNIIEYIRKEDSTNFPLIKEIIQKIRNENIKVNIDIDRIDDLLESYFMGKQVSIKGMFIMFKSYIEKSY